MCLGFICLDVHWRGPVWVRQPQRDQHLEQRQSGISENHILFSPPDTSDVEWPDLVTQRNLFN